MSQLAHTDHSVTGNGHVDASSVQAGAARRARIVLLAAVRAARRMAAVGLWGASASIAAAAGPSLGGLLVHATNWRSVFVINIPIGLATLIAGRRSIVEGHGPTKRLPDLLGTV